MGCIESKSVMTVRSMSIREDYLKSNSFQSAAVAWEDLLTSRGDTGNDQLYAFVRSANSKSRSSSAAIDLIQDVKLVETEEQSQSQAQPVPDGLKDPDFVKLTKSKSCHEADENKLYQGDKNLTGSRSFHTVEEYDALMERIRKAGTTTESPGDEAARVVEYKRSGSLRDLEQKEHEKGSKRKAVAKGLKSLDVSQIEFPAVARVKQWIHVEGQAYSPGTYVTPKFGTYNGKVPRPERQRDTSVFSPELLAAFEDCMHQLQEEEESIISIMNGHTPVDEVDDIAARPSPVV